MNMSAGLGSTQASTVDNPWLGVFMYVVISSNDILNIDEECNEVSTTGLKKQRGIWMSLSESLSL